MRDRTNFSVTLFYSYSHKDLKYRQKMEDSLALLRDQDGVLDDWSDQQILPGQNIQKKISEQFEKTDIFVFLVSQDFIASNPCREEWSRACEIASEKPGLFLVPVILTDCAWKDLVGMSELKALPNDGRPIRRFDNEDVAWQQVYQGLKAIVDELKKTFAIRDEFRKEMEATEFLSQERIDLKSLFVFPNLVTYSPQSREGNFEVPLDKERDLLRNGNTLVHGERFSGKTALCRHLFLKLVDSSKPVLYLDLEDVGGRVTADVFSDAYRREFHGDYALWEKQNGKVIILDNLSRNTIETVLLSRERFDQIIVTLSTEAFDAYYKDDDRLAEFREVKILPLTHVKQEKLIRKRVQLLSERRPISDGQIDEIERQVNSVIISSKILPRYPFYVLSILQTYEAFMPTDLSVTSYGHCYYVLIIAHLLKSGIAKSDDEINACLNFVEHFAFKIYCLSSGAKKIGTNFIEEFKAEYGQEFIPLKNSTLNRLFDNEYGIIDRGTGRFRKPYVYYYFLGKYLANNSKRHKEIIDRMVAASYTMENSLTLIFTIHHTNDSEIIEEILLNTMCAIDNVKPTTLERNETEIFEGILKKLPPHIRSRRPVRSERVIERERRDMHEQEDQGEMHDISSREATDLVDDIYRILKNNEILGQILRNRYGSLRVNKVVEIIETIVDGGLRLVRLLLAEESEVNEFAAFVAEKYPEFDPEEVKEVIRKFVFLWTMHNVERIVGALNKPEVRSVIEQVVKKKDTPAYDLIGYYLLLDTAEDYSDRERDKLKELLSKHRYPFFKIVASLRTQHYLNTHRVSTPMEQSICSLLGIKYRPRLKRLA